MKILIAVAVVLLARPAQAQSDLASAAAQVRGILSGRPAPAGDIPQFTGAPVRVAQSASEPAAYKGKDFTLKDLGGRSVSLSQFAGQYVIIDFSATWCGPCNASIPKIQETHTTYAKDGLAILAVYAEDAATVREHMAGKGVSYPILVDPQDRVGGQYLVRSYPTFILLGPDGTKLGVGVGQAGLGQLVAKYKQAAGR